MLDGSSPIQFDNPPPPARVIPQAPLENNLKIPVAQIDRKTLLLGAPYITQIEKTARAFLTRRNAIVLPPHESKAPSDEETREHATSLDKGVNAIRAYQNNVQEKALERYKRNRTWSVHDAELVSVPEGASLWPPIFVGYGANPPFLPDTLAALDVISLEEARVFFTGDLWTKTMSEGIQRLATSKQADMPGLPPPEFAVQLMDQTLRFTLQPDLSGNIDRSSVTLRTDPFANINDGASSETKPQDREKATVYAMGLGVGGPYPDGLGTRKITPQDILP